MNASSISRILKAAGIQKSELYKSGIKRQGYRSTEGYKVETGSDGQICVSYKNRTNSFLTASDFLPKQVAAMERIATVLEAKGYAIEFGNTSSAPIVVTAKVGA